MKIQESIIDGKKVIQIYLSEEERNNVKIQEKIKQIKDEKKYVVLFVSGKKDINITLKQMLEIMRKNVI